METVLGYFLLLAWYIKRAPAGQDEEEGGVKW